MGRLLASEAAPRLNLRLLMRAYDCLSASRSGAKVGRLDNMAVGIYTTGKFQLVNIFLDTGHPRAPVPSVRPRTGRQHRDAPSSVCGGAVPSRIMSRFYCSASYRFAPPARP